MVHVSGPGNAVKFEIGIWRKRANGDIDIASQDKAVKLRTTVSNNPDSKRYHPNLYRKLEAILAEHAEES